VRDEPHLAGGAARRDPSESRAEHTLSREHRVDPEAYRPGASVYDEPDILPGRTDEIVAQDWTCRNCGYNLRGLKLDKPCPECGQREWYRPPPPGRERFRPWLLAQQERTSERRSWMIAALAALLGGPLAVVASLLHGPRGMAAMSMPLIAVVIAPVMEEMMKVAAGAYLVEARPYLFRRAGQLYLATVGAALVFAAIENALYLSVYIPNPSIELILWRWTACVALHTGCTAVATRGLLRVWQESVSEFRPPRIGSALPSLVTAIILHGAYNAAVMGYDWLF
jgi:hypothetical protein